MAEYAIALIPLFAIGALVWLWSVRLRDVSIVDPVWSLLFVAAGLTWWWRVDCPADGRALLVLALVTLWGLRLAIYLTIRKLGEPEEDRRYAKMRAEIGDSFWIRSLVTVFSLQAVLAWIIAAPIYVAVVAPPSSLGVLAYVGVGVWLLGYFFQVVGDAQLRAFKNDAANKGRVLNTGLWRYTRHPNYFGEFAMWWGIGFIALDVGTSAAWWSLIGPFAISFLLLKVSGVTMLESDIGERRPKYADYIRRTNAFFPGPPSKAEP